MLNNIVRCLVVGTVCFSVIYSQSRAGMSGVSLDGSTGLFLNPSPETLGVGHVRLGTSRSITTLSQNLATTIPLAISLGLTGRTELYYSTNSWEINNLEKEKNATLGIRINILNLGNNSTSVDFRWQNIGLFTCNQLSSESQRIISRAITEFSILNLKTYTNIGYISLLESAGLKVDNRFIGGIGILIPIIKQIHGVIDFQVDERLSNGNELIGSMGIKWFLFKHIQVASGFNSTVRGDNRLKGFFLNLSFSSEVMTGPRKRIRTKKGLPVPPILPTDYFALDVVNESSMENMEEQKLDSKFPLDIYISNFLKKEYINELPMIPPIDQLDLWRSEVINGLDRKKKVELKMKKVDLPFPPALDEIGIQWEQKPAKQKKNQREHRFQ